MTEYRVPTVPAKTIVTRTKNNAWFGTDYTMNLYRGCCHGCIYCDSRSECYQIEAFDSVRVKENALLLVERELRAKRKKGLVGTGSMSDPYNPWEKTLALTRGALQLIERYQFGVAIATKSPLVQRDADVLNRIGEKAPAIVKMTITTAEDALCQKIEPYVAPTSKRFEALEALSRAGIYCGILLMPLLPYINDTKENVLAIVQRAADCGVKFIYPGFGVTLRDTQQLYFYQQLDRLFPGIKARYLAMGNNYVYQSPKAQRLMDVFQTACEKNGIVYRMTEIIKQSQRDTKTEQLSFF
jgi:DNA repair photolyase